MATNILIDWDATPTDFTLTNLHSLAGGNIWVSNQITADPQVQFVQFSAELHTNGSVAADEQINFYLARGDDGTGEIRTGAVSTSEQELSAANAISDFKDAAGGAIFAVRIDRINHDIEVVFMVENPGKDFQFGIELDSASGALDASGNLARYLLGRIQTQ